MLCNKPKHAQYLQYLKNSIVLKTALALRLFYKQNNKRCMNKILQENVINFQEKCETFLT